MPFGLSFSSAEPQNPNNNNNNGYVYDCDEGPAKRPGCFWCCRRNRVRPKATQKSLPLNSSERSLVKENGIVRNSPRGPVTHRGDDDFGHSDAVSQQNGSISIDELDDVSQVARSDTSVTSSLVSVIPNTPEVEVSSPVKSTDNSVEAKGVSEVDSEPIDEPTAPSDTANDVPLDDEVELLDTNGSPAADEAQREPSLEGTVSNHSSNRSINTADERIPADNQEESAKDNGTAKLNESRVKTNKKDSSRDTRQSLYPPTLPAYDHPKEALAKSLLQLENPEWEVVLQGLQGLVRLSRHHPKVIQGSMHNTALLLTRQVKNLRSQVARAACQAARELFISLGRAMDPEVDDIAGALLARAADTNKFLRADSSSALEAMVEHASPNKSVSALVNKGARHQNAIVRAGTCKLLLMLCSRLGPERVMSLPKETRDAILVNGAKFLTEGSLDTRKYAKDLFSILSSDPKLYSIMTDVVPGNVMRCINKVLLRITGK